jgi:hypothetical protein
MEAAALGVASSVCQLIDFACKLLSSTHQIYKDGHGTSIRKLELETAAETIATLTSDISTTLSGVNRCQKSKDDEAKLRKICDNVTEITGKVLAVLDRITITSGSRVWSSFREALSIMWNEDKIASTLRLVEMYRADIDTFMLVLIR